jgi:AAA family ATP:ADP antiporter
MAEVTSAEFSKWRRIFFPIHSYELKKVMPMSLIFFFILFNYSCLRNIKDALVVTGPGSDAEVIPFLKGFCVMPSAVIFMLLYAKASDILSNERLFYATLSPFILFFGAFAFFIYPNLSVLHPSLETVRSWQAAAPQFLRWPLAIIGIWSYALFYILAEIWGSAILSLSFWQFANQVTKTSEAKRVYAFFGLMAQLALLFSGWLGEKFSVVTDTPLPGVDPWQVSLNWLMGMVVCSGVLTMLIYRWIYCYVLPDKRFYDKPELPGVSKRKKKAPFWQSLRDIFMSPYLLLIAALIVCYGIGINLTEGLWKKQLGQYCKNPNAYNTYMSRYTFWTGICSIVMMIVGGNILRAFRWFTAAAITPAITLILGSLFFIFVLFKENLSGILGTIGLTPLFAAVLLGTVVLIIAKSTKYALFDLTKEMAYIPLDEEMKVKGKAVVEVVGGRLGKAGGAWIQAAMLALIPGATYFVIAPYVFGIFILICSVWLFSVKKLSVRIEQARSVSGEQSA